MALRAQRLDVDSSPAAFQDYFEAQGWTDGLPVVPPLPDLVDAMVAGSALAGDAVLGQIGPSLADVTVEKVAINAVMAGCRPAYMPVVVAAVRAVANPVFNIAGFQGTTHPGGPMVWVNGPVRTQIGLNCGTGVFGQGFRANATIGRAVRLVLMNIGGGLPGKTDMATHGTPGKFTYCGGENEEQSPWGPYHLDKGFAPEDSTVMVFAADGPTNVNDHDSTTGDQLIPAIAESINSVGINNVYLEGEVVVVLGPEHASIMAASGYSKEDVRQALWKELRLSLDRLNEPKLKRYKTIRKGLDVGSQVKEVPLLDDPTQLIVLVAGGPGKHSLVIPGFGMSQTAMEKIILP